MTNGDGSIHGASVLSAVELSHEHIGRLSALLTRPLTYVRRLSEVVALGETKGLEWSREIEFEVPKLEGEDSVTDARVCIVSLGLFDAVRLGDLRISDKSSHRAVPLSRTEHAQCMAAIFLRRISNSLDAAPRPNPAPALDREIARLAGIIVAGFRDGPYTSDEQLRRFVAFARLECRQLFIRSGVSPADSDDFADLTSAWLLHVCGGTHYLYWVSACPGERVSLKASWTMPNPPPRFSASNKTETRAADLAKPTRVLGSDHPRLLAAGAATQRTIALLRQSRLIAYSRLGLIPVPLSPRTPAIDHAASYYLEIRPPANARATLLDWQTGHVFGSHLNASEVLSAHPSCNVAQHHGIAGSESELLRTPPPTTLLLKSNVNHAAPLWVAAAATALTAYSVQRGAFVADDGGHSASSWVFLAPAAMVAYIVSLGEHYFARYYRALRYFLMMCALIIFAFGASALFDLLPQDDVFDRVNAGDDVASFLAFVVSLAVLLMLVQTSRTIDELDRRRTYRLDRIRKRRHGSYSALGQFVRTGTLRKRAPEIHPWRYERRDFGHMYMFGARRAIDRLALAATTLVLLLVATGVLGRSALAEWGEGRSAAVAAKAYGQVSPLNQDALLMLPPQKLQP